MPTTADEWELVQSWTGDWETQAEFDSRYDRLGDLDGAILESVRAYRTKLVNQASTIQVEDISVGYTENIRALDRIIEEFTTVGGTEETATSVNVTKLVRTQYR